jgi:hypothetical protein
MIITETHYSKEVFKKGKCPSCGEKSNEILIEDGRCVDCVEEEKFIVQTMKTNNRGTQRSPFGDWS